MTFFVALALPFGDVRIENSIPASAIIAVIYLYFFSEIFFISNTSDCHPTNRNYIKAILTAIVCTVIIRIAYYSYENCSNVTMVVWLVISIAFLISGPFFVIGGMNGDEDPTK